jgi:hypothetical protein
MKYVKCINSLGYEESVELNGIYNLIDDQEKDSRGFIEIVDKNGDCVSLPALRFVVLHRREEQAA